MATCTLVQAGRNRLRFLLAADGTGDEAVVMTTTGAATAEDILTAALTVGGGPIVNIAKAHDQGYGVIPAGALTQAQARALWLSDWGATPTDIGNENIVTATCRLTPVSGTGSAEPPPQIDADVAAGEATLEIVLYAGASAYLDIEVPGTIGA